MTIKEILSYLAILGVSNLFLCIFILYKMAYIEVQTRGIKK